jgi:hypothetical protein
MRRLILLTVLAVAAAAIAVPAAWAGAPHFINSAMTASASDSTLTVSGKEAGLGDETQITVVLSADALCINNGGNHPKAVNKTSVSTASNVPVQNGKADYTLTATATFQPSCSPPMTVEFRNVTITDTTNNLTFRFGTVIPS